MSRKKASARIHSLGKNEVSVRKLGHQHGKAKEPVIIKVKTGGKPRVDRGRVGAGTSQLNAGTRQYQKLAEACGDVGSNGELSRAEALYKALPHEERVYQKARGLRGDAYTEALEARSKGVDNFDNAHDRVFIGRRVKSPNSFGKDVQYAVLNAKEASRLDAMAYNRQCDKESRETDEVLLALAAKLNTAESDARDWAKDGGFSAKEARIHAKCVRALLKAKALGSAVSVTEIGSIDGKPVYGGYKSL